MTFIVPLEDMGFTGRAMLLHGLFPSAMPALLQYIAAMAQTVAEDLEEGQWHNANIPFELWTTTARDIYERVSEHRIQLENDSGAFALQLFDGYKALFTAWCLRLYAATKQHQDKKFVMLLQLLFDHEQ